MERPAPKAMPDETKPAKVVKIKPRFWETETIEVTLRPTKFSNGDEWEVYDAKGTWVGTISRYSGSLDRQAGRLRIPGKERILWSEKRAGSRYTMWDNVSRADAIRALLNR